MWTRGTGRADAGQLGVPGALRAGETASAALCPGSSCGGPVAAVSGAGLGDVEGARTGVWLDRSA